MPCLFLGASLVAGPIGARANAAASSQQQTAPGPTFDVAAIHPHISEPHEHNSIWSSSSDGQFKAENISALALIHWAWEMPDTRIVGAPDWVNTAHFNIEAKADPAVDQQLHTLTSGDALRLKEKMVQALLAERFKLVVHSETRELPIYHLVVAKGGPRLGATQSDGTTINHGRDHIEVQGADSLGLLAEELSKEVGRDVVNETGIQGRYDVKLRFTPDEGPAMLNGQPIPDPPPGLFTALQEQLGLKLEPAKGPVQVLVIDHIEMPSAN